MRRRKEFKKKILRRQRPLADRVRETALAPVSYTHLDVYKRQVPFYIKILHKI